MIPAANRLAFSLSTEGASTMTGPGTTMSLPDDDTVMSLASSSEEQQQSLKAPLVNDDGQTHLHLLCQNPRSTVTEVQNLIQQYPEAAQQVDVYNRTAIFYALKRACSLDVVRVVYEAYPAGILIADFAGESGLHLLYHSSKSPRILQFVLSMNPEMALYRSNSFSARPLLHRICDPWVVRQPTGPVLPSKGDDSWIKLLLTVQAAYQARHHGPCSTMNDDDTTTSHKERTGLELHLALQVDLPTDVLCHFVQLYPEQVKMPMTNGQLPLHHVLSQPFMARTKGAGGALVRLLVHAHPAACSLLWKGQYPLHMALSNGFQWTSGVREVAFAYPDALSRRDAVSRLLPFLIPAVKELGVLDVATTFCLLREQPVLR